MTVAGILAIKGNAVVTLRRNDSIAAAARLLAERRIGAIVITDADNRVQGILSERDLVRVLAEVGGKCLDLTTDDVMTKNVTTCTRDTRLTEVMEIMTAGKFRHLPVVANGRLDGIISIGDVVKHRLAEIDAEKEALKEYIATA